MKMSKRGGGAGDTPTQTVDVREWWLVFTKDA